MLKTRSGVKKRVKVTWSWKFIMGQACNRHLLSNKSKKAKLRNKYGTIAAGVELKKIKAQLPFA